MEPLRFLNPRPSNLSCLAQSCLADASVRLQKGSVHTVNTCSKDPDQASPMRGFDLRRVRQHSSVEIDHEIFATVNLSLQDGWLSVSGKRMCICSG